ncbi:MAG: hypothetical protein L6271_08025 [Desulfobacteraceae bacterium]|nr:hypothetical protein [Desulfobacteraceae bacterium]
MFKVMERKKILIIWLCGSITLMFTAAVVSILIWNFIHQPELNSHWKPITAFWGMVYLVPVGWLLSFLTPLGWASIVFMGLSVYKKWPALLLGAAISTVISGVFWPMTYAQMMGY